MRRIFLAIAIIFATTITLCAQDEVKRVAILKTVDEAGNVPLGVKLNLRSTLAYAISHMSGYEAYTRVNISEIMDEQKFQRTGYVSDSQIKKLGEMTGASYVLVAEAAYYDENNIVVTATIIDVETARIKESSQPEIASIEPSKMRESCIQIARTLLGKEGGSGGSTNGSTHHGSGINEEKPLTMAQLKASGFRFLKQKNKIKVISQSDFRVCYIYNVDPYSIKSGALHDGMSCYGGEVSENGMLNGVVILKNNEGKCYLVYICEGKMTFPVLEVGYYDGGVFVCVKEAICSYGCIFPSWSEYRNSGLCASMREVYGTDLSSPNVRNGIFNASIDLTNLENAFKRFVRRGGQLNDSWSDDPKYTAEYEGMKPVIEGYTPGEFDESLDAYRPINNGLLTYSYIGEHYCDGIYESDEPRYENGHALHIPSLDINPDHFRILFSFMAVSNKGWCQGHSVSEQYPLRMDCGKLGMQLNEDGTISITTYVSGRDHFYETGWNYSVNRYVDIDMEYDHGQFIINGHRFNIKTDLSITEYCDYSIHSVNYSDGNAFKGFIKDLKIYSFSD